MHKHLWLDLPFRPCYVQGMFHRVFWQDGWIHQAIWDFVWRESHFCPPIPQIEACNVDVCLQAQVCQEENTSICFTQFSEGVCLGLCLFCLLCFPPDHVIDLTGKLKESQYATLLVLFMQAANWSYADGVWAKDWVGICQHPPECENFFWWWHPSPQEKVHCSMLIMKGSTT